VAEATRRAFEVPLEFPPLRKALTPDDHVAIIVREETSQLANLLVPTLEVLRQAGVKDGNVTFLCPPRVPGVSPAPWQSELPPDLQTITVEVHDPAHRDKLAYLASTKSGRRVYLNRSLVDADQLIVVGRFGYDPMLGYAGGLSDLFPALSDEATRGEFAMKLSEAPPGARPRPVWQEIEEISWLLGMPFLLQVVEGFGDGVLHVLAGLASAVTREGQRLLDQQWRVVVDEAPELVVATLSGEPARHSFADLTAAMASAARVVRPGGRIVLLTRVGGELGPCIEYLRQAEDPAQGLALVRQHKLPDATSAWQLATAAQHAQLFLLSNVAQETAEELFVTPLDSPGQVQRLIDDAISCLILPDAHKTMAVLK
jgi:nickel-dependent lactate racemase